MKIGIDARPLETGHKFRGIGAYTSNLIKAISKADSVNQYIFFTQTAPSAASKLDLDGNFKHQDILIRKTDNPDRYNYVLDQLNFPKAIRKANVTLVHFFEPTTCLQRKTVKTVVTVHDLVQISHLQKNNWKKKIKFRPVRSADKIIAISEAVKKEIIEKLNIPGEKIKVIYNGYNDKLFKAESDKQKVESFRKKLVGEGRYILYAGSFGEFEECKNLNLLLEIMKILAKDIPDLHLVMVGKPGPEMERIKAFIKNTPAEGKIIFPGHKANEEMPLFYQAAVATIVPSKYEGFGLPALEAMACGCPVVASNVVVLPEVVGNAGILLAPENEEKWAEEISKILKNKDYQDKLSRKGLEQAKKFSWDKTAKETIEVYKEVYSEA